MTAEQIESFNYILLWFGCGFLSIIECFIANWFNPNPEETLAIWDNKYCTILPKLLKFSAISFCLVGLGFAGFVVCFIYMCINIWGYLIKKDLQKRNTVTTIETPTPENINMSPRMREWMRRQTQEMIRREQEERLTSLQEVPGRDSLHFFPEVEREMSENQIRVSSSTTIGSSSLSTPQKYSGEIKQIIFTFPPKEEKTNRFGIMEID